jgi:outer membrane protein OmpA-like peptidoglycan-associated protein
MIFSLTMLVAQALAQDVSDGDIPLLNAQTFHPSMDSHEFFRAVDSDLGERGFAGRAVLSYTLDPLQYTWWDGRDEAIVSNLLQLDVVAAYTVGPFRIGVDLPVILRSFGGLSTDATGLGDLGVDAKIRALDNTKAPIGLALSGRVWLPTSTAGGALGTDGVGVDVVASVDKPIGKKLDAVLDLGFTAQPTVVMENVTWGPTASVQAGLAYRISEKVGVVGELYTSGVLADFANEQARPTELLVGGWYRTGPRNAIAIRPAVAFGLNDAVTSPRFRGMLGVAWDPLKPKAPPDADKDGIADASDPCPNTPEDVDTYEDTDGCPELANLVVTVVDTDGVVVDTEWTIASANKTGKSGTGVDLPAGEVEATASGGSARVTVPPGGAAKVEIRVPAPRGTLAVEVVDMKGTPIPGATWSATGPTPVGDTVPGSIQARPGTYTIAGDAPGYRPVKKTIELVKDGTATLRLEMVPARAVLQAAKIEIKDSVYFETGKTIIKPESFPLLDEIADILKDHPELTRIRIEGNTDSRGSASANQTLSQGRAESVAAYFVTKGVAATRLEALGNGESKPLVKEKSSADQAKNRRVDFFVVGRSDADVAAPVQVIETKGDAPKAR